MQLKNLFIALIFSLSIIQANMPCTYAAEIKNGQRIQIRGELASLEGSPTWLVLVRNLETGYVQPVVFDIDNRHFYGLAVTKDRAYRIIASQLKWGTHTKIDNFCQLMDKGIIAGKSIAITLRGNLSSDPKAIQCRVEQYEGGKMPGVSIAEETPTVN